MAEEKTTENWWKENYSGQWWQEYPNIDREYISVYPCDFHKIDPSRIWQKKEITFYVHVPFCQHICKFCVFNKYSYNEKQADLYIDSIQKEINMYTNLPYVQGLKATALYYGGGTPTALNNDQLTQLMIHINEKLNIEEGAEITVEAYPMTVDREKLQLLRDLGANRVSFGVQSFNDNQLENLEIVHRSFDVLRAIDLARSVGFPSVSIDLMYKLPGQTLKEWESTLDKAVETGVNTISIYNFAILPGTRIFKEALSQPNSQTEIQMYQLAIDFLHDHGYHQYSIADFALEGWECIYVTNLWRRQTEILGFGPSAISYSINGYAFWNIHNLQDYLEAVNSGRFPVMMGQEVSIAEKMSRLMVLGLRCLRVSRQKFRQEFNIDVTDVYNKQLDKLQSLGLITVSKEYVALTEKGKIYIDNISKKFFTPNNIGKIQPIGIELQKVRVY